MSARRVALTGFEEALAAAIATGFRFAGQPLEDIALVVGRHLFVGWLPSIEEVKRTVLAPATFDEQEEPVLALYAVQPSFAVPSASEGGKHDFTVEVALRIPKETRKASALLAELLAWLEAEIAGAELDGFTVAGVGQLPAPSPFRRSADGTSFSTARVRFLVATTNP